MKSGKKYNLIGSSSVMKILFWIGSIVLAFNWACSFPEHELSRPEPMLNPDLVHFDIYVLVFPDTTLNRDEQCQLTYATLKQDRDGYQVNLYKFYEGPQGKAVIAHGFTDAAGNYKALNLPPDTYQIVITDPDNHVQEVNVVPTKGALTKFVFEFFDSSP